MVDKPLLERVEERVDEVGEEEEEEEVVVSREGGRIISETGRFREEEGERGAGERGAGEKTKETREEEVFEEEEELSSPTGEGEET